jgi:hypothetical protein
MTNVLRRVTIGLGVVSVSLMFGCQPRERRETTVVLPSDPVPPSAPREADRLRDLALDVQTPRDPYEESEAIKRLRAYLAQNNLTYTTRAVRADSDAVVESPATSKAPVRVTMEVFRGREPLYTFTFVPRDNRNLAQLGQ